MFGIAFRFGQFDRIAIVVEKKPSGRSPPAFSIAALSPASSAPRGQAARRRAKLSQETPADGVGRTPESISNIERGKQLPSIETLSELARVLKVPLTEFSEGLEARHTVSRERALLVAELMETARQLAPRLIKVALEPVKVLKKLG